LGVVQGGAAHRVHLTGDGRWEDERYAPFGHRLEHTVWATAALDDNGQTRMSGDDGFRHSTGRIQTVHDHVGSVDQLAILATEERTSRGISAGARAERDLEAALGKRGEV
jgi:hypothetical protein